MIKIKKVSQIGTIIKESEKKVKKIKNIIKKSPRSNVSNIIFNEIKNKLLDN